MVPVGGVLLVMLPCTVDSEHLTFVNPDTSSETVPDSRVAWIVPMNSLPWPAAHKLPVPDVEQILLTAEAVPAPVTAMRARPAREARPSIFKYFIYFSLLISVDA